MKLICTTPTNSVRRYISSRLSPDNEKNNRDSIRMVNMCLTIFVRWLKSITLWRWTCAGHGTTRQTRSGTGLIRELWELTASEPPPRNWISVPDATAPERSEIALRPSKFRRNHAVLLPLTPALSLLASHLFAPRVPCAAIGVRLVTWHVLSTWWIGCAWNQVRYIGTPTARSTSTKCRPACRKLRVRTWHR